MVIYNKKPINVMLDILNGLNIRVFKHTMREDANSIPSSYILLKSDIVNTIQTFGDGDECIRTSSCDISIITKGYALNENEIHYVNVGLVEQKLKDAKINYSRHDLGYDKQIKSTQTTFAIDIKYYG